MQTELWLRNPTCLALLVGKIVDQLERADPKPRDALDELVGQHKRRRADAPTRSRLDPAAALTHRQRVACDPEQPRCGRSLPRSEAM
ncbi:MAG: hypothetical protein ACRDLY_14305 [Thermoleophilaceae bacterium]